MRKNDIVFLLQTYADCIYGGGLPHRRMRMTNAYNELKWKLPKEEFDKLHDAETHFFLSRDKFEEVVKELKEKYSK